MTLGGQAPQYGSGNGRLLTPEERLVLVQNTSAFIEALEAERVELESCAALQVERQRENELARAASWQAAPDQRPARPEHIDRDARSPMYEEGEMLRWRWRTPEAISASVAEYYTCPSRGPFHARVMAAFGTNGWPTPYSFALDVELKQCLPKPYILRTLDELNLIERVQAEE